VPPRCTVVSATKTPKSSRDTGKGEFGDVSYKQMKLEKMQVSNYVRENLWLQKKIILKESELDYDNKLCQRIVEGMKVGEDYSLEGQNKYRRWWWGEYKLHVYQFLRQKRTNTVRQIQMELKSKCNIWVLCEWNNVRMKSNREIIQSGSSILA
jgi:hypothetical protein